MTSPRGLIFGLFGLAFLATALFEPNIFSHASGDLSKKAAVQIRVIDGDTFQDIRTGIKYRLENVDTPEIGSGAKCAAERELGERAAATARAFLVRTEDIVIQPTGRLDRYGRTVVSIKIGDTDLGNLLIEKRLARPWRGHREPWCDADGN